MRAGTAIEEDRRLRRAGILGGRRARPAWQPRGAPGSQNLLRNVFADVSSQDFVDQNVASAVSRECNRDRVAGPAIRLNKQVDGAGAQVARYQHMNLIQAGHNYGWPQTEGFTDAAGVTGPLVEWPTDDCGPSGIAISHQVAWIGAVTGHRLWRVPLLGDRAGTPQAFLVDTYGRLRTAGLAPDGSLWLTTSNTDGRGDVRPGDDRILRLAVT